MIPLFAQAQPNSLANFVNDLARTQLSQVVIFVAILTAIRVALFPYLKNRPAHLRTGIYPIAKFFNEFFDALVYAGVFVFLIIRPFGVQTFRIPSGSMVPTLLVNDFIVANKAVYRYSDPKVGDIVVFRPPLYAVDRVFLANGEVNVDYIKRCLGVPGEVVYIKDGVLFRNGKEDPDRWRHFSRPVNAAQTLFEDLGRDGDRMPDFKLVKYEGSYEPWRGKTIPVMIEPNFPMPGVTANYMNFIDREFAIGAADSDDGTAQVRSWKGWDELTDEEKARMKELADAPPAPIPPGMFLMVGDNRNNSFDGRFWGLVDRDSIVGRSEVIWLPLNRIGSTR